MQKFIYEFLAFNKNKWLWMLQQESTIFLQKHVFEIHFTYIESNQIILFQATRPMDQKQTSRQTETDRNT